MGCRTVYFIAAVICGSIIAVWKAYQSTYPSTEVGLLASQGQELLQQTPLPDVLERPAGVPYNVDAERKVVTRAEVYAAGSKASGESGPVLGGSSTSQSPVLGSRAIESLARPTSLHCERMQLQVEPSPKQRTPRNLKWLHFPKAGTSFFSTLWNYACGQEGPLLDVSQDANFPVKCGPCYDMALKARYPKQIYCKSGILHSYFTTQHSSTSIMKIVNEGLQVTGFFRQPSQRLISAFHASHASGLGPEGTVKLRSEWCKKWTAACFARAPGIAGCTARMLAGGTCAESPKKRLRQGKEVPFDGGKSYLKDALRALQAMAFVGLTERWDESVCLFHRMFGGRISPSEFKDVHKGSHHKDSYNESVLEGFRDEVDEVIYKAAQERFEHDLHIHAPSGNACAGLVERISLLSSQEDASGTEERLCSCKARRNFARAQQRGRGSGYACGQDSQGVLDCGSCPDGELCRNGTCSKIFSEGGSL